MDIIYIKDVLEAVDEYTQYLKDEQEQYFEDQEQQELI